jgi:hypothetical protein
MAGRATKIIPDPAGKVDRPLRGRWQRLAAEPPRFLTTAFRIIHPVLLVLCGLVFLVFGAAKVLDPAAFASAIDHYRILPWPFAAGLALYLPWLECICAAALLMKKFRAPALEIMLAMSLVFLAAMSSAMWRGLNISCGCFGEGSGHLGLAIARDLALIATLAVCLTFERTRTEG